MTKDYRIEIKKGTPPEIEFYADGQRVKLSDALAAEGVTLADFCARLNINSVDLEMEVPDLEARQKQADAIIEKTAFSSLKEFGKLTDAERNAILWALAFRQIVSVNTVDRMFKRLPVLIDEKRIVERETK